MRVRVRMKMRRGQARGKMKGNKMTNFILNVQIRYDYLMFKPIVGVKTGMGERVEVGIKRWRREGFTIKKSRALMSRGRRSMGMQALCVLPQKDRDNDSVWLRLRWALLSLSLFPSLAALETRQ